MSTYKLPNRSFLRLSGADAERYLNGQITQKVSDVKEGKALWTAVTNAKGGIEGVGCLRGLPDGSFLFDCPTDIGDEMELRLDKYLIADDCEWFREDDQWQILLGDDLGKEARPSNRFRVLRDEVISQKGETYPDFPESADLEWRAQNAVPAWGKEIQAGVLPAECGLYDLALSFDKGCYIGQEIISRMEAAGKTRSNLYQVTSSKPLTSDSFSTFYEEEEANVGLTVSKKEPRGQFLEATIVKY